MYNIKENARTHLCLQSKRLSSGAVLEEVGPADSMRCKYQPLAMNHMSQMDYLCVVREMLAKGVQVFDAVQCNPFLCPGRSEFQAGQLLSHEAQSVRPPEAAWNE